VIPQRNISLLSNRIAAGGGLRIREDVLERDYCLAWLLNALAESDLQPILAFKGGTALKRCYFADYRSGFSTLTNRARTATNSYLAKSRFILTSRAVGLD
jgi:predicted nucleotidyltransferase component of viral defense system